MALDREENHLIHQSSRRAIALALEGRWREAVEANREILASAPDDVDALNRLGRAYMELKDYDAAHAAYQRAKELDPYNSIAEKNLKKLVTLKGTDGKEEASKPVELRYFIEETGKSGVVKVINLAPKTELAKMAAGNQVVLEVIDGNLAVNSEAGVRLGLVEPRHGHRLARLMKGGNKYLASVTSVSDSGLTVIIREIFQDPSQFGQTSFPSRGVDTLRPLTGEKVLRHHLEYEEETAEEPEFALNGEEGDIEGPPERDEANEDEEE
jgi:hypothetical protein